MELVNAWSCAVLSLCMHIYIGDVNAAVTTTDCSTDSTACNSIAHAECDTTNTHMCKCSVGFQENGDQCDATPAGTSTAVLGTICSGLSDCSTVAHAVCDGTCKCPATHTKSGDTCTPKVNPGTTTGTPDSSANSLKWTINMMFVCLGLIVARL